MGRPKLLLPLGNETIIARFLRTLAIPEITETVVVLRRDDTALQEAVNLAASRSSARVTVLQPDVDPAEMRASVEYAIAHLARSQAPAAIDGWLLCPADHPSLDRGMIESLARHWQTTSEPVLIPVHQGRRGHPVLLSWELAAKIAEIPAGEGLNWLVRKSPSQEFPVASAGVLVDLDTPDDYAELQRLEENSMRRSVP